MNEENKVNYYAVIPATVRYDKRLKPSERLLYGEITALSNTSGYCYAQNRYFADLYEVTIGTVSKWISHLQELNYIKVEITRNEKQEITSRHIYIMDLPYGFKKQYPYNEKKIESIAQNDIENNTDKYVDELFSLIISNDNKIPNAFYLILEDLEFTYSQKLLKYIQKENIQKLKEIIYTLYSIYNSNHKNIIQKFKRKTLVDLYFSCKEHNTKDFFNYYKQSIINKYH